MLVQSCSTSPKKIWPAAAARRVWRRALHLVMNAVAERVKEVFSVQEERKRQYVRLERQVNPYTQSQDISKHFLTGHTGSTAARILERSSTEQKWKQLPVPLPSSRKRCFLTSHGFEITDKMSRPPSWRTSSSKRKRNYNWSPKYTIAQVHG